VPTALLKDLDPRLVCVIKPSALGDVTNAFATLAALRSLWPSAHFAWVINRSLRGLVENHPMIDEVIPYDRAGAGFGPKGAATFLRFLSTLRQKHFDLAIDLQGLLRSGVMTAATRAPVRVGLSDAREGAPWFYTHRVRPPGSINKAHAIDRLLSVAAAFGADISKPRFVVAISDADREWAEKTLASLPRPRLALNLGARWETKRWPPEHFAEVARRAVAERSAGLFAIGAPEDLPLVEILARRLEPTPLLNLCGKTTLPQLAALAEASDLVLSNDTGPLHLATAAGARVVGIYTCTKPELNGPFGARAATVRSSVNCAGSYHVKCPNALKLECMTELTPEKVWPVILAQLESAGYGCTSAFDFFSRDFW